MPPTDPPVKLAMDDVPRHWRGPIAPAWLLTHPTLTAEAKLAWLGLKAHDGPGGCWPSCGEVARQLGLGRTTFVDRVAELEELGLLKVHRRHNRSSIYTFPSPADPCGVHAANTADPCGDPFRRADRKRHRLERFPPQAVRGRRGPAAGSG
jgi:hypothetical protein